MALGKDMLLSTNDLNQMSIAELRACFKRLQAPAAETLVGAWRGSFVGPAAYRARSQRGLDFMGLPGWWGKEIRKGGEALNIVVRDGIVQRVLPMRLIESCPSGYDGKPCAALHYPAGSPWRWRFVMDELRLLDETRLLALGILRLPLLRRAMGPFLLERAEPPG